MSLFNIEFYICSLVLYFSSPPFFLHFIQFYIYFFIYKIFVYNIIQQSVMYFANTFVILPFNLHAILSYRWSVFSFVISFLICGNTFSHSDIFIHVIVISMSSGVIDFISFKKFFLSHVFSIWTFLM